MPRRHSRPSKPAAKATIELPHGTFATSHAIVELTTDNDRPGGITLWIDGTESSYIDLEDPGHLEFEYMQHMMLALEAALTTPRPRVVHLGGAGCTLARAIHATWPQARQLAIEWDALLAAKVRDWFDLPRSPLLRIRVADAREAVEGFPDGSKDVIIRDVFSQAVVPEHVTTVEFTRAVAKALSSDGLYLANTADRPPLTHARREAATIRSVFKHVLVIAEPGVIKGRRYGNLVIAASNSTIETTKLEPSLRSLAVPTHAVGKKKLSEFIGTFAPLLDAPTSNTPTNG